MRITQFLEGIRANRRVAGMPKRARLQHGADEQDIGDNKGRVPTVLILPEAPPHDRTKTVSVSEQSTNIRTSE